MPANGPFQGVLWDMDGVVLDSMGRHAACWRELLARRGYDVSLEFILSHEGCLNPEVFCEMPGFELSLDEARNMMAEMLADQARMYINRHSASVRPFAEAVEALGLIAARGVPMALVTSSNRGVVTASLGDELTSMFRRLITADDVSAHKPDPEPYLKAAEALGLEIGRCLVVENAPAGIEAARRAGATCYALTTTLGPEHLGRAHAVFGSHLELARAAGLIPPLCY